MPSPHARTWLPASALVALICQVEFLEVRARTGTRTSVLRIEANATKLLAQPVNATAGVR